MLVALYSHPQGNFFCRDLYKHLMGYFFYVPVLRGDNYHVRLNYIYDIHHLLSIQNIVVYIHYQIQENIMCTSK
jgi:hypothetical protein